MQLASEYFQINRNPGVDRVHDIRVGYVLHPFIHDRPAASTAGIEDKALKPALQVGDHIGQALATQHLLQTIGHQREA